MDLFQHASKAVRFPIPQLALAQVASYFAIPKVSRICDGLAALSLYQEYRSSRNEDRRAALKADLLEYNRDDLEALVGVAERIAGLRCGSEMVPAAGLGANKALKLTGAAIRDGARLTYLCQSSPVPFSPQGLGIRRNNKFGGGGEPMGGRDKHMKLRMYQLDVEVTEGAEITISQDRREGGGASSIVISMDQVEFLYSLLQKAKEEIESRSEAEEEEERKIKGDAARFEGGKGQEKRKS